jgi:hypothetical protein
MFYIVSSHKSQDRGLLAAIVFRVRYPGIESLIGKLIAICREYMP